MQPIAEHVAAAELLDHFAVAAPVGRLVRDRLVKVRIEIGAERFDRAHAALAQDLEQLPMDELDAAAIGFRALGARRRPSARARGRRRAAADPRTTSAAAASAMLCRSRSTRLR